MLSSAQALQEPSDLNIPPPPDRPEDLNFPHQLDTERHTALLRRLMDTQATSLVHRPLHSPSRVDGGALLFDREGPLASSCRRWSSWTQLFTRRLWTFGYEERAVAAIFDALPARFCESIQSSSERVWGAIQAKAIAAAAISNAHAIAAPAPALAVHAPEPSETSATASGPDRADTFLECLEDIWERDGEEGFIEFAFDPASQQRVNVILNSRTAALAGMHKEEVRAAASP